MAQYTTEALVLSLRNWGDADKMVTLLTKERGRIKAAAFGCRRPRSPLAGGMQLFNYLDVQLTEGQRLDTVKQCTLRRNFKRLSEDLTAMAYGAFVAELAMEFSPEHVAEPALFDRLVLIFAAFETRNPRITALAAAYQLLEFTGLQLHYERCVHCGREINGDASFALQEGGVLCSDCRIPGAESFPAELRELILGLLRLDWQGTGALRVHKAELLAAERLLLAYLQSLFGRPLRSLAFIQQLAAVAK